MLSNIEKMAAVKAGISEHQFFIAKEKWLKQQGTTAELAESINAEESKILAKLAIPIDAFLNEKLNQIATEIAELGSSLIQGESGLGLTQNEETIASMAGISFEEFAKTKREGS